MREHNAEYVGNQQRKNLEVETSWLAGFWDGEGTISLRLNRTHAGAVHGLITPYAQIGNTSPVALVRVREILSALNVGHHVQDLRLYPRPHAVSKLPQWRVVLTGFKRTQTFLQQIAPYLVVKRESAEVVQAFITLRSGKLQTAPYEQAEWDLLDRIRAINGKGGVYKWQPPTVVTSQESPTDYTLGRAL